MLECYHWTYPENYAVFPCKGIVQEGICLGHIVEGEKIGIGFPYIHNVYRITKDGAINFVYHFVQGDLERIL